MNIKSRLDAIEKAMIPGGMPEHDRLQIIVGCSINGQFVPNNNADTVERRSANLKAKYGTDEGAIFIKLVDSFQINAKC